MNTLKLGKYKHYKGKEYEVIGIAKHSKTLKDLVVYQALHDSEEFGNKALWVRPMSIFMSSVSLGGKKVQRFTPIKN
jgi:hypothetical protein